MDDLGTARGRNVCTRRDAWSGGLSRDGERGRRNRLAFFSVKYLDVSLIELTRQSLPSWMDRLLPPSQCWHVVAHAAKTHGEGRMPFATMMANRVTASAVATRAGPRSARSFAARRGAGAATGSGRSCSVRHATLSVSRGSAARPVRLQTARAVIPLVTICRARKHVSWTTHVFRVARRPPDPRNPLTSLRHANPRGSPFSTHASRPHQTRSFARVRASLESRSAPRTLLLSLRRLGMRMRCLTSRPSPTPWIRNLWATRSRR